MSGLIYFIYYINMKSIGRKKRKFCFSLGDMGEVLMCRPIDPNRGSLK